MPCAEVATNNAKLAAVINLSIALLPGLSNQSDILRCIRADRQALEIDQDYFSRAARAAQARIAQSADRSGLGEWPNDRRRNRWIDLNQYWPAGIRSQCPFTDEELTMKRSVLCLLLVGAAWPSGTRAQVSIDMARVTCA
jgi:hypothetical protein